MRRLLPPRSPGLLLALVLSGLPAAAFDAAGGDAPATPVEKSDELTGKATASVYVLAHSVPFDVNLRKRFGAVTTWVGVYVDPSETTVGRVGVEYDFQSGPLLLVPSLQAGTNGFVNGSLYTEIGRTFFGIAGYSVTNLRPMPNLNFDPNDSIVVGAGMHLSPYDKVSAFSVVDVRLGTGQQDTHLLYRRRLGPMTGLTIDLLFKSGHRDDEVYVRGTGLAVYLDRPDWFLKAAYDPWVNFSAESMVRLGAGLKF